MPKPVCYDCHVYKRSCSITPKDTPSEVKAENDTPSTVEENTGGRRKKARRNKHNEETEQHEVDEVDELDGEGEDGITVDQQHAKVVQKAGAKRKRGRRDKVMDEAVEQAMQEQDQLSGDGDERRTGRGKRSKVDKNVEKKMGGKQQQPQASQDKEEEEEQEVEEQVEGDYSVVDANQHMNHSDSEAQDGESPTTDGEHTSQGDATEESEADTSHIAGDNFTYQGAAPPDGVFSGFQGDASTAQGDQGPSEGEEGSLAQLHWSSAPPTQSVATPILYSAGPRLISLPCRRVYGKSLCQLTIPMVKTSSPP